MGELTTTEAAPAEEKYPGFGPRGWGDFRRLWSSSAVSALGDGMRMTALPLLAVSYTRQPALLALVTVAGTLPMLLSPLAGVAADRWPRKTVMVRVDTLRFVLVAVLGVAVWTHVAGFALVCAIALLLGIGEVLFTVTSQAILPQVVHTARLSDATGRQYATQTVSRDTLGQPLGGLLFAVGTALPFLLDAASFLAGLLLMSVVRTTAPAGRGGGGTRQGWGEMIREGYRYLRGDRLLIVLAGMLGFTNFFLGGVSAVFVLYVVGRLGLHPGAYGFFLAAGALGGVAAGTLAARLERRLGTIPAALGCRALAGVTCLVLGLTRQPYLAAGAFLVMCFGSVVYQTLTVAFRQAVVPSAMLGRVNGVYRLLGTGPGPVGALVGGLVAQSFGVQTPFLLAGAAQLLLIAVVGRWLMTHAAKARTQAAA